MKVKFITLGCKVNQYETQALREQFAHAGYEDTASKADLYVINTCTVTARADAKSKEIIRRVKRENPQAKIAVSGCFAQLDADKIAALGVDYIIPQDKKHQLVDIVLEKSQTQRSPWSLAIHGFSNQRAFIKIQDGCDNRCSFCKVPLVRGNSVSREKNEIIDEVKRVSLVHKEIVLCGVNIGLYGRDFCSPIALTHLLEEVLALSEVTRIRLSSLEASLVSDELLSFLRHPKLCPHIHIPFQSGDDKILTLMNKKETVSLYETLVGKIRKINPLCAISCDIITGFIQEDDDSFRLTFDFIKRIKPMRMHIFTYSPRKGTSAAYEYYTGRNSKERFTALKALGDALALAYEKKFIGMRLSMITEEHKAGFTHGYTENYIKVSLRGLAQLGQLLPVAISEIEPRRVVVTTA